MISKNIASHNLLISENYTFSHYHSFSMAITDLSIRKHTSYEVEVIIGNTIDDVVFNVINSVGEIFDEWVKTYEY